MAGLFHPRRVKTRGAHCITAEARESPRGWGSRRAENHGRRPGTGPRGRGPKPDRQSPAGGSSRGSKPCRARAGRKSSRSQPARVSSARVLSTSGGAIGASATARAIARWLTSTSRLRRSRARVRCAVKRWQKRVARLTLRVSRVSIQRLTSANPSGRSALLAALLAGASARIAIPSPRGFQASRTDAQETRPSSDERSGTAQVAGRSSSPPRTATGDLLDPRTRCT